MRIESEETAESSRCPSFWGDVPCDPITGSAPSRLLPGTGEKKRKESQREIQKSLIYFFNLEFSIFSFPLHGTFLESETSTERRSQNRKKPIPQWNPFELTFLCSLFCFLPKASVPCHVEEISPGRFGFHCQWRSLAISLNFSTNCSAISTKRKTKHLQKPAHSFFFAHENLGARFSTRSFFNSVPKRLKMARQSCRSSWLRSGTSAWSQHGQRRTPWLVFSIAGFGGFLGRWLRWLLGLLAFNGWVVQKFLQNLSTTNAIGQRQMSNWSFQVVDELIRPISILPSVSEPTHLLGEFVKLASILFPNLPLLDKTKFSIAVLLPKSFHGLHVFVRNLFHLSKVDPTSLHRFFTTHLDEQGSGFGICCFEVLRF